MPRLNAVVTRETYPLTFSLMEHILEKSAVKRVAAAMQDLAIAGPINVLGDSARTAQDAASCAVRAVSPKTVMGPAILSSCIAAATLFTADFSRICSIREKVRG